jgi:hypothetical protein
MLCKESIRHGYPPPIAKRKVKEVQLDVLLIASLASSQSSLHVRKDDE